MLLSLTYRGSSVRDVRGEDGSRYRDAGSVRGGKRRFAGPIMRGERRMVGSVQRPLRFVGLTTGTCSAGGVHRGLRERETARAAYIYSATEFL